MQGQRHGSGRRCIAAPVVAWIVASIVGLVVLAGVALPVSAARLSPSPPLPDSMAAIGDSFTVGYATGAPACEPALTTQACSWSTGTGVDSHYARILFAHAAIAGHAHNVAVPGSTMATGFVSQATSAASYHPDYLTVMLGAADICISPTMTATATFTSKFTQGMDALFAESPNTKVLVASVFNLESFRQAMLAAGASGPWGLCGYFFNQDVSTRATMMSRVTEYNEALASVCASYVNCRFDANAYFRHAWTAAEVNPIDKLHPSQAGQAMIADMLWTVGYWGTPGCRARATAGVATSGGSVPLACP